MKRTDPEWVGPSDDVGGTRPDRLGRVLIGTSILLSIAIVGIVADLVLRPTPGRSGTHVIRPAPASLPSPVTPEQVAAAPTSGTPPRCTVPGDWGIHIVEQGNTLFSLAQKYGSDVDTLGKVNCLNTSTIFVGQRLYVPGPLALPTHATPTGAAVPDEESATSTPAAPLPTPTPYDLHEALSEDQIHIVLLGTDERPMPGQYESPYKLGRSHSLSRTDAIIVVSVDTRNMLVRAFHIPRDLWVDIPGHGYDRINTAEVWGDLAEAGSGTELLKKTIEKNLGIPIQYYVQVNFAGFIDIVNALGGVDIDVACPLPELNMEPGMRHMDGVEALVYVQRRTTSSDFDRGRRQRQMLMELWDQLLTPENIAKLPQLWIAMAGSYKTDLPLDKAISLAYFGLQLKPQQIMMADIDGRHVKDWTTPEGAMVLVPIEDKFQAFLQKFYGPVDTTEMHKVEKIRVEVLNASERHQAEKLAGAALDRKGFRVLRIGQSSRQDLAHTEIYLYKGDPSAGEQLAKLLGVPANAVQDYTTIPDPPDFSNPVDARIVLGADYDPCWR